MELQTADSSIVTHTELPEGLFRDLIDAASDFVGTIDRHANIVYINPAGRRLLEIPDDEDITGTSVLPYNETPSEVKAAAAKILKESGEKWTGVSTFVSRSGRRIPVSQMMVAHVTNGTHWYSTIAREISVQIKREEELQYRADHDPLTGLLNRGAFKSRVSALEGSRARLLVMLDIDRFKTINDTFGHHVGDEVLIDLAQTLSGVLNANSFAARLGGDEFAVVLEEANDDLLSRLFVQIEDALQCALKSHGTSTSIGRSVLAHPEFLEEAMRVADADLYRKKRCRRSTDVRSPRILDETLAQGFLKSLR